MIAIDGPAGAGKSTVARRVASALGYLYIDTGAMYRAVTLAALESRANLADPEALGRIARERRIELRPAAGGGVSVFLDGRDVTDAIRDPRVDECVSLVAQVAAVRAALVEQQRRLAAGGRVVMDGRDIGTYVLPHADCKVYLTASVEERARRRASELRQRGIEADPTTVEGEIVRRDRIDSERQCAPLRQAPDAVRIDTTGRSAAEVADEILRRCGFR